MTAPMNVSPSPALRDLALRHFGSREGRRLRYEAGDRVYRAGDHADSLYFLESGRVRVFVESPEGKRKTLRYVEPGGFFGEGSLGGNVWSENCDVDRAAVVVRMPLVELDPELARDPALTRELMSLLADNLCRARAEIDSLVFDSVRERVLRRLWELMEARVPADQLDRDEPVTIDITHAQLAMAVGAARETVSTDVEDLKREDVLQIRRGRLEIRPERLRRALDDAAGRRRRSDSAIHTAMSLSGSTAD